MRGRHLYVLTSVLVVIGAVVMAYRAVVLEFPLTPHETTEIWRVETRIEFEGRGGPAKATLMLPNSVPTLTVFDQSFVSPGFGLATASPDANRYAVFSTRRAEGMQVIYYRAVIQRARSLERRPPEPEPVLQRARYKDAELAAARSIIDSVDVLSADGESFVRLLVQRLKDARPGDEAALLLGGNPTSTRLARVAVRLLGLANVPARQVNGFSLVPDRRDARFESWIELYEDGVWRPFDLATGEFQRPKDHVPWWRGDGPMVRIEGGRNLKTSVAVQRTFELSLRSALTSARGAREGLTEFSIFGLPLQTQEVYRTLLTVPAGIFLLVILRNVIGLRTFGTFMPVLIALAFRETGLVWGLILFGMVLAVGLGVRFYLERLKLLLVPRLACVVIVVVMTMALLSIVSHKLGFERGLSVALFPIVILAMTIERMSIVWDERGPSEAFLQAGGSLTVAVAGYAVMNIGYVQHLMFVFPEVLLFILAATLLLGRYSGYRLVELPRFKVLAGRT